MTAAVMAAAGMMGGPVLSAGSGVHSANSVGSNAEIDLKFDQDGGIYTQENLGGYVKIGDWLLPNEAAPGDYQIRYTGLTGDPLTGATAAEDTWHAIASGDFVMWNIDTSGAPADGPDSDITVELRRGSSGGAQASGAHTLTAQRIDL